MVLAPLRLDEPNLSEFTTAIHEVLEGDEDLLSIFTEVQKKLNNKGTAARTIKATLAHHDLDAFRAEMYHFLDVTTASYGKPLLEKVVDDHFSGKSPSGDVISVKEMANSVGSKKLLAIHNQEDPDVRKFIQRKSVQKPQHSHSVTATTTTTTTGSHQIQKLKSASENLKKHGRDPLPQAEETSAKHRRRNSTGESLKVAPPRSPSPTPLDGADDEEEALVRAPKTPPHRNLPNLAVGEQSPESRVKQRWSAEEEETLYRGVAKYGKGKWKVIVTKFNFDADRRPSDLKDKWRNIVKKDAAAAEARVVAILKQHPEYLTKTKEKATKKDK